MAFRRRRRSRLVSWLPIVAEDGLSYFRGQHDGVATGAGFLDHVVTTFQVIRDIPAETLAGLSGQTLSDYEQSGYMLRRIVGKFFCASVEYQSEQDPLTAAILVGLGFMILRVNTNNAEPLAGVNNQNYNLFRENNARDPWIWRRTWMLSNGLGADWNSGLNGAWSRFPSSNAEYGSAFDGPHIDARTVRRVGPEERLFGVVTTAPIYPTASGSWHVSWTYDLRVIGSPLRMSNRRNASR